jgi:hypothetical protein
MKIAWGISLKCRLKETGRLAQVVEPSKYKALSSNFNLTKKRKRKVTDSVVY